MIRHRRFRESGEKYRLTDETKTVDGTTLCRIEALKDFGNVRNGDFGGWVEGEDNLSQDGYCWVYDNAKVYGNAKVHGSARVTYSVSTGDIAE